MKGTTNKAHVAKTRITRDPIAALQNGTSKLKTKRRAPPEFNKKRAEVSRPGSAHINTITTTLDAVTEPSYVKGDFTMVLYR